MLAEKLIEENLKTQNPILDLGRCGLDGTEIELYRPLQHATHLHTLILSDYYWNFDAQEQLYVGASTQNQRERNKLQQIPPYLPQNLQKLTLNGDLDYNETPAKIKDYTPLLALKNLRHLEVDNQENLDLEVIGQLVQLRVLTCFFQKELKGVHHLKNLQKLEFLDVSDANIEGIEFVQALPQLQHFFGGIKFHEELETIAQLKQLKTLVLDHNEEQLTNLHFLSKLTALRKLSLQYNDIENVDSLRNLQHLTYLDLTFNQVENLKGLAHLTQLKELNLSNNRLQGKDLFSLEHLTHLKKLDLSFNQIYHFTALRQLTQLEVLNLQANQSIHISDLGFLANLSQLKELNLEQTNAQHLEELSHLQRLEKLHLSNNLLEDIQALASLTNLQKLTLQYNNIKVTSPLKQLKKLQYLDISHNPIEDIDFLENLACLETFIGWDNKIRSLKPLANLKKLEKLRLGKNFIRNADALQRLTSLKSLNISWTNLQDISFVKNLTQLTYLGLKKNKIRDISPLAHLPNLNFLHLEHNPIQDIGPLKDLPFIFDFKIDHAKLHCPPIWYAYAKWERKPFSDYTHLAELPQVEKIWQLMRTKEVCNLQLAQELAKGQGWTEEAFKVYQNLLNEK